MQKLLYINAFLFAAIVIATTYALYMWYQTDKINHDYINQRLDELERIARGL